MGRKSNEYKELTKEKECWQLKDKKKSTHASWRKTQGSPKVVERLGPLTPQPSSTSFHVYIL